MKRSKPISTEISPKQPGHEGTMKFLEENYPDVVLRRKTDEEIAESGLWVELDDTWRALCGRYAEGEVSFAQLIEMLSSSLAYLSKKL